jgi:anti-anti-sigma factor
MQILTGDQLHQTRNALGSELVESSFQVQVRNADRGAVIVVSGELDLASAPTLEEELDRAAANGADLVIVDLRELEFIDSTGLGLLIKANRQAEEAGRRFAIVRGQSQVQRLLGVTGIEQRLTLVDSPEELLETAGD